MAEDNFDEEFQRAHQEIKKLQERVEALEQRKALAVEEIELTSSDGGFRVRIRLDRHQLTATPMLKNAQGQWIAGPPAGVNARWQIINGSLVHFSST